MLKFIEVKGNDYEIGYQIGQYFKKYLKNKIIEFDKKVHLVNNEIELLRNKLEKTFPNLLQEIYGRADGADIKRSSFLLMVFPEIYERIDGCTTVIVKKQKSVLFAHNEDNVSFNLDNVALVKYNYGDRFIISYTMAERLAGSAFSYNSSGLLFSSNYVYSEDLNLDNLSRYIVVRDIINSKSVEEVLQKLKNSDVASAFSLNVLDTNTNRVINIEKDVHDIYVTEIKDKYARSNHFHAKEHDESEDPKDSKFRYEKANELINKLDIEACCLNDLINILKYQTDNYYECVYKQYGKFMNLSVTDATLCIDTSQSYFTIYDYIGKSILKISFDGNLIEQNLQKN